MTANSLRLPAKIYRCHSENQGKLLPFEKLCAFLYTYDKRASGTNEFFSSEIEYESQVMMTLIFLYDLNFDQFKSAYRRKFS